MPAYKKVSRVRLVLRLAKAHGIAVVAYLLAFGLISAHSGWAQPTQASNAQPARLEFVATNGGEFYFDTGVVRGKLRPQGKSIGLASVVHVPSGIMLDRGDKGYGLFSHYRVFTTGKRYGHGAWDWPSTARLRDDGTVEVTWGSDTNRPFEMRAVYRWTTPDALDLDTIVTAQQDLPQFESFLASYFSDRFTNALVFASSPSAKTGEPRFMAAEQSAGVWQMFPRDAAAVAIVNDGRWQMEPNPVKWVTMPALAKPIGVRRDSVRGVAAALMARPTDCFAVMTPFQTESHYSLYLSLFGRTVKAGETARARTRLLITGQFSEQETLKTYRTCLTNQISQ